MQIPTLKVTVCLPACQIVCLSVCLTAFLTVCQFVYLIICRFVSIYLSFRLFAFANLSDSLFICLRVCVSFCLRFIYSSSQSDTASAILSASLYLCNDHTRQFHSHNVVFFSFYYEGTQ